MTLSIRVDDGIVARSPEKIRHKMKGDSLIYQGEPLTRGHKGAITGYLNKWLGNDDNRRLVLSWLFSTNANFEPISSKQIGEGNWFALSEWIGAEQDSDGVWNVCDLFPLESILVLRAALRDYYSVNHAERDGMIQRRLIDSMVDTSVVDLDGYIVAILDEDDKIPDRRVPIKPDKISKPSRYSDTPDYGVNF